MCIRDRVSTVPFSNKFGGSASLIQTIHNIIINDVNNNFSEEDTKCPIEPSETNFVNPVTPNGTVITHNPADT